jgi:hypothetical protein
LTVILVGVPVLVAARAGAAAAAPTAARAAANTSVRPGVKRESMGNLRAAQNETLVSSDRPNFLHDIS